MTEHTAHHTTPKILVTGFDRFGHLKRPNASSEVALPALDEKYGDLVETLVLPTARDIAAEQLLEAIKEIDPVTVVMFGISAGHRVRLEHQAKNVNFNLLTPDNNGVRKIGRIEPEGPNRLASTLPLDAIYSRLDDAKVPVKFSSDAGTFICNEVMYKALRHAKVPTGFVHLGNGLHDQLVEDASVLVVDEILQYNEQHTL